MRRNIVASNPKRWGAIKGNFLNYFREEPEINATLRIENGIFELFFDKNNFEEIPDYKELMDFFPEELNLTYTITVNDEEIRTKNNYLKFYEGEDEPEPEEIQEQPEPENELITALKELLHGKEQENKSKLSETEERYITRLESEIAELKREIYEINKRNNELSTKFLEHSIKLAEANSIAKNNESEAIKYKEMFEATQKTFNKTKEELDSIKSKEAQDINEKRKILSDMEDQARKKLFDMELEIAKKQIEKEPKSKWEEILEAKAGDIIDVGMKLVDKIVPPVNGNELTKELKLVKPQV